MSTKKKFRVPHSFVIVFSIIIAAVLLTWIIPAGEYARVENADGIKVIDPTQFNYIARTPVNPLLIPMYIVKAFIKRVDIMLVILFSGGAFPHADPVRRTAGSDRKAGKEILQQPVCVHSDPDPDVWSDLHHPGCKHVHCVCSGYGNAGAGNRT